jgi:uncharacterized protein YndB with AHSA1/START domain
MIPDWVNRQRMAREYLFIDEWDVDAPIEAVFEALADAATYPEWWRPVYIDVQCDGPPEQGRVSKHHSRGDSPTRCGPRPRSLGWTARTASK